MRITWFDSQQVGSHFANAEVEDATLGRDDIRRCERSGGVLFRCCPLQGQACP